MVTLYCKLVLPGLDGPVGTGWLPPRPDLRDYTVDNLEIKPIIKKLGKGGVKQKAPTSVDLRQWCYPIENQLSIG